LRKLERARPVHLRRACDVRGGADPGLIDPAEAQGRDRAVEGIFRLGLPRVSDPRFVKRTGALRLRHCLRFALAEIDTGWGPIDAQPTVDSAGTGFDRTVGWRGRRIVGDMQARQDGLPRSRRRPAMDATFVARLVDLPEPVSEAIESGLQI
jgi:hypothetical protein